MDKLPESIMVLILMPSYRYNKIIRILKKYLTGLNCMAYTDHSLPDEYICYILPDNRITHKIIDSMYLFTYNRIAQFLCYGSYKYIANTDYTLNLERLVLNIAKLPMYISISDSDTEKLKTLVGD